MTEIDESVKYFTLISVLATLFGLSLSVSSPALPEVALDAWQPMPGDRLVVDTKENIGFLVHEDGQYASFPVLTGQRRTVHYIGRTYNAATPVGRWTVKESEYKGRSTTFGETGLFLRLFKDGEERTAYGIHSHLQFQLMLDQGNRYRSMGCILVSEDILLLIKRTFEENGNTLDVATAHGISLPGVASSDLSWIGM